MTSATMKVTNSLYTGTYSGQEVVRSISRRTVARVGFDFREEGCSRFLVFRGIEMCFFGCEGVIHNFSAGDLVILISRYQTARRTRDGSALALMLVL